jgi:translation initiation factor IF-3
MTTGADRSRGGRGVIAGCAGAEPDVTLNLDRFGVRAGSASGDPISHPRCVATIAAGSVYEPGVPPALVVRVFAYAKAFRLSGPAADSLVRRLDSHSQPTGGHISTEPRINDRIRVPEVRLVGPAGEQVGIVKIETALQLARDSELDLVEVAPMARPPVAKLMDYGKFKYENAQKVRESRRNQTNTVIKEMKLRPKIDSHDYETKKGHVVRFLKAGDKVKITIMFRGREQSRPELGYNLLKKLAEDVDEFGFVESAPKQDGRNMLMVLGPHKKKTEARAEVRAERDRRAAARQADAEAEHTEQAARRAEAAAAPTVKRRRGPADNLDPDVDLN